ncbi:MAG: hypothetical protein ACOCQ9_01245 [Candidatus Brocadiia bacterium]
MKTINAENIHYRQLNRMIRDACEEGETDFVLNNVRGQRYLGTGLSTDVSLHINGTPGADLAALMDGASIRVNGNAQAAVANTMNGGSLVIHGSVGDIMGYSLRGGRVLIRDDAGYRAGIHMKAYRERRPEVVIGGTAGDYLGEYMAGGILVVLGATSNGALPVGKYIGTGMHGGTMYIRGELEPWRLGAEVGTPEITDEDWATLSGLIGAFCDEFGVHPDQFNRRQFTKLVPVSARPYGKLYAY